MFQENGIPLTTVKLLDSYDGVFVTFKGFHPSRINGTKFAYGKVSDDNLVTKIREKSSFTEFPEAENASSGIYGFSSGAQMLESITYQINKNLHVNGEFYTSLTLGAMLENKKRIINQNMDLYYSWGTPEDLETFNYYLDICRNINFSDKASSNIIEHNAVVLAAGKSSRLRTLNKKPKQSKIILDKKQLLDFSFNLIESKEKTFLVATVEIYSENIYDLPQKNLRILTHASESQIATVEISLELIEKKDIPVTFLASDNIMFFDKEKKLEFNQSSADLLVWTSVNFPVSKVNSEQYSWVKVNDDNTVENVIYKNSPKELRSWKLVTGNFTFRNSLIVRELIEGLSLKLQALNREPILDDLVGVALSLGYNVRAFDVTEYVTLGTELEERVFDYHSEIFKHEYSL